MKQVGLQRVIFHITILIKELAKAIVKQQFVACVFPMLHMILGNFFFRNGFSDINSQKPF